MRILHTVRFRAHAWFWQHMVHASHRSRINILGDWSTWNCMCDRRKRRQTNRIGTVRRVYLWKCWRTKVMGREMIFPRTSEVSGRILRRCYWCYNLPCSCQQPHHHCLHHSSLGLPSPGYLPTRLPQLLRRHQSHALPLVRDWACRRRWTASFDFQS